MQDGYNKDKPFIFISYKHEAQDQEAVKRTIGELRKRYSLNIWYDAELVAGRNWDDIALQKMRSNKCMAVLLFASKHALISAPVASELKTAKRRRKIIIPINFEMKSFSAVLDEIIDEYNDDQPELVDIAEQIIEEHLDDKLTYIVLNPDSDDYYRDIYRALQTNAPQLFAESEAAPAQETASPEPAAAPVSDTPAPVTDAPAPVSDAPAPVSDTPAPVTAAPAPVTAAPQAAPVSDIPAPDAADRRTGKKRDAVTYTVFGSTRTGSQSEMMFDIFREALAHYPEKYAEMLTLHCTADTDYTDAIEKPTQFRSCRSFPAAEGKVLCVGTSYSIVDKLRHIAKLADICGMDSSTLAIEGYPLPETRSRSADGKAQTGDMPKKGTSYLLYGTQHSENQTEMMCRVFAETVQRHPDRLPEVLAMPCVSADDYSKPENRPAELKSMFHAGRWVQAGDAAFYVGTAYNLSDKLKLISTLLRLCGEPSDVFQILKET